MRHVVRPAGIQLADQLIRDHYAPAIAQTWAHLSNTLWGQHTSGKIVNKLGTPATPELAGDGLTSDVVVSKIGIKTGFERPGAEHQSVGPVYRKYQGANGNF